MNSRKNIGIRLAVFVFMPALVLAIPAMAVTRYVPSPYPTIQLAIDASAVTGDEIEVAPGTYVGAINFNGKAITLRSTDPNDPSVVGNTVIHGGMASSAVTCNHGEGPDTVLAGFTIRFGYAVSGGGMYNLASSPTVRNCAFTNNYATSFGGGMYNMTSSPTVINCTFSSNSGGTIGGGGMCNWAYSSPTVTNCTFNGNTASQDGGGMYNYSSSPTVTNCNFSENSASQDGGGMCNYNSSSPTVTDCNFSENSATQYGGGMYCENSSPTVTECRFVGNSGDKGAGMYCDHSSPTVRNCTFTGNSATKDGGGMFNSYSSPTVTNCIFAANSGDRGGGIYNDYSNETVSHAKVTNCTLTGNTATSGAQGGGGMFNYRSSPSLTNCIFSHNSAAGSGGGIYNLTNCAPTVTNCTFTGNTADEYGGGIYNYHSSPTVTNCILWANGAPEGQGPEIFDGEASTTAVTYSDVQGDAVWPGQGNTNYNPSFVSPAEDDLRLRSCSPCVDAGNKNAVPGGVTTDIDGNPRFMDDEGLDDTGIGTGPIVDMGAYERQEHTTSFNVRNITRDVNYCSIQSAIVYAYPGDVIEVGPGTYDRIVLLSKAITIYSTHGPNVTFIDAGGYGTAVTCMAAPPSTVLEGFTITGGNATKGGGMFNSLSSLTVRNCTFTGNTATTDGGGMFNSYSSPTVRNCTFTGNSATEDGGGMFNSYSSPTVTNCIFAANSGDRGGGIYNDYSNVTGSHAKVTNCAFTGNTATSGTQGGGGMFNYRSSPSVTNCVFSGNSAGGSGGGIYNLTNCAPTVTNSTFTGNTADEYGGGIYNYNSSPMVTNCILWANGAPEGQGPEIFDGEASTTYVTYSDIQGWTGGGTGNINSNPLFVNSARGDFRMVSFHSPCVDAGNNNAVPVGVTTDLAGNPRFVDGDENGTARVDMGAYEFNGGPVRNLRLNGSYLSIQAAIDDADTGDEIEAGPGTYYEAINFKGKAIRLYSSGGPEATTIDATGLSSSVVNCTSGEDSNTILEGFTITGGSGTTYGEYTCGGGMNNSGSSPTVIGCNFTDNKVTLNGGGMYNQHSSSPTVTNCTFMSNSARDGGGMFNWDNSSPTVTNCTFSGNIASREGGGMKNTTSNSNPTVTNCILWGDMPNEIVDTSGSASVVTYSDVQGGWSGEGNIDKNPLLRNVIEGDLSLVPWSPCIDIGNNDVLSPGATDITGLKRLIDGDCNATVTVDMGAHEFRHAYGGDFDSSCLTDMADFAILALAWLTDPLSENWDHFCDISTPADGLIDKNDLKVFVGNWLHNIDTPITCDANQLKNDFGLDATCTAAVLSAAPCAYSPNDVAQALHDVGYSADGTYKALTQVCGMTDIFRIEQILHDVGYPPEEYIESTALESVRKFAPVLYFDQDWNGKGLPMSAQVYFETVMSPQINSPYSGQITWTTPWNGPCGKQGIEYLDGRDEDDTCGMTNNDFSTLINGEIPTYYKVISDIDSDVDTGDKGRLRIAYWWFYGFQYFCNSTVRDSGEHHGDWEHIIVTTDPDRTRADAVTYSFHDSSYTRLSGDFETEPHGDPQGRPVVYVGRLGHGSYHSDGLKCRFDPILNLWLDCGCLWTDLGPYHCCRYADCRTPDAGTKWYNAYENLVSLSGNFEPWMSADRIGSLYEYYGQQYGIAKWRWGPHISFCHAWEIEDWCIDWHHTPACQTHPTVDYPMDWDMVSCGGLEGCGTSECIAAVNKNYPVPINFNQGWPWGGGAASSASESASPATSGAVASCGRCGASWFSALVRLGNYWLATP